MVLPRASKEWIRAVADHLGISVSELASKSGVAPSTLTRYLNDASGKLTVTDRTLDAITAFSGVPKHVMPGARRPPGMGEPDAVPWSREEAIGQPAWVNAAVEAARQKRNGVEPWVMKGRALDLLGVLPGDILIIDQNRLAKSGDVVCVQITDFATGGTETVMRLYDPPYVVAHSAKLGPIRPELVDDDRVVVMGVSAGLIRTRD